MCKLIAWIRGLFGGKPVECTMDLENYRRAPALRTTVSPALTVTVGDITRLDVDAIVNAANTSLLGGSGVDGAIHRAAGPELRSYCETLGGCATGEAKTTPGFSLKARLIIHAVGPDMREVPDLEAGIRLLEATYRSVLREARANNIQSLAVPAISCGVYAFPKQTAAAIAVRLLSEAVAAQGKLISVQLVAFDEEMAQVYRQAIADITRSADRDRPAKHSAGSKGGNDD